MPNIKFHQKAFGYVQICKVNATYTFEQFYLIESRLCVVRSALDHLEGDKFLVTEKKEETFLVSNTSKAARNSAAKKETSRQKTVLNRTENLLGSPRISKVILYFFLLYVFSFRVAT